MKFVYLSFFLLFFEQFAMAQRTGENFTIITTYDTLYIENMNDGIRYKRILSTPDTIFFDTNGYVFEYNLLDKPCEFVGGTTGLIKWLTENFQYPDEARANNIFGKVGVKFIIDQNGKVLSPEVIKPIHPLLDKEAIRLVKSMPIWYPGERAGKKVQSFFTLPVNFRLGD